MKVVLCGSYGDFKGFLEALEQLRAKYGKPNVFPDDKHLRKSKRCIRIHHKLLKETQETILIRADLMNEYFDQIDKADIVVIRNEKNGQEYYGIGTTIEIGYTFAKQKTTVFTRETSNSNVLSLIFTLRNSPRSKPNLSSQKMATTNALTTYAQKCKEKMD